MMVQFCRNIGKHSSSDSAGSLIRLILHINRAFGKLRIQIKLNFLLYMFVKMLKGLNPQGGFIIP